MTTTLKTALEDLYDVREHGKAEIVNGEIVRSMPTGAMPSRAGGFIYSSLLDHERGTKSGHAFPDNTGFIVSLSRSTGRLILISRMSTGVVR
jgi:Uma2 family endonuclease